jgi:hypothetical protein
MKKPGGPDYDKGREYLAKQTKLLSVRFQAIAMVRERQLTAKIGRPLLKKSRTISGVL